MITFKTWRAFPCGAAVSPVSASPKRWRNILQHELTYKQKQFERLFASRYDFAQANFCACYLLKKGWHSRPWERRGTIYQQQTAFVTNLIIAYARPFTSSKGWPAFPLKLVDFNKSQKALHERMLQKRHEIFAHSDSRHFKFIPGEYVIERVPFTVLSMVETKRVKEMTKILIKATSERIEQLQEELEIPR
jgi:hypothetical protein